MGFGLQTSVTGWHGEYTGEVRKNLFYFDDS